jgi:hypothetical protein
MKKFKELREHSLEEKLKASDPAGTYISDFVHSDNPKFAGKSKAKRIQMALAASYAAKGKSTNEEVEQIDELSLDTLKSAERKNAQAASDYHMDDNKHWARKSAVRALSLQKRIKKKEKQTANEEVEELEEDKYDRMLNNMLKKNPGVLKTHSKEVQKYNDINSGKALKQNIKKNPGVLKTHSKEVQRTKKMYGEDFESVEEGVMNAVKNLAKKASKALTGGSDEDQRKDLQRKMGVPQTGKKPMQK